MIQESLNQYLIFLLLTAYLWAFGYFEILLVKKKMILYN